ncbi:MAG: tetratricopeptide repeat protein [Alphaproteobacteria bacterium]|nr:tetratricopeptide repeat protein [Alphaproteobacteria bacterium]
MPGVKEAIGLLQAGLARHAAGDAHGALALFEKVARDAPALADAHYLTGAVLSQLGRDGEAIGPIERALALSPDVAAYHGAYALALKGAGRHGDALAAFARQIALAPADADARFNYANALAESDAVAAERAWRAALELQPDHPGAAVNLGNLLAARGDWAAALAAFERAPGTAAARVGAAAALVETGKPESAQAQARAALALEPANEAAWRNLGIALAATGRVDEALAAYANAGEGIETRVAAGAALASVHRYADAARLLADATRVGPENFGAWLNLGTALAGQGRYASAREAFSAALRLRPGSAKALANLANAELYCGDAAAARPHFAAARGADPADPAAASSALYALNYDEALPAAELVAAHRAWGESLPRAPRPARRAGGGRLRVGLVSGDFCHHSCAFVLASVLPHFERGGIELHAYSNTMREDAVTARLRPHFDHWHPVVGRADADVAAKIQADGIDVLVDLAGHTNANRLGVFARRPARVQATWLGYPATTGLPEIDLRVVDAVSDPDDTQCIERVARVDGGFLAFEPPPSPAPARAPGPPTFGSFNNVAKLGPRTVACWARVLKAAPEARLLLKGLSFEDAGIAARYRELFAAHGISPDRLDLVGWIGGSGGHLDLYSRIDVALDPLVYNGTLTTLEALWMGVPVVSLAGDRHGARVGASILTHLGRPSLIAASEDDYVERALEALRVRSDRAGLRAQLAASPLMDGKRLARALTGIWQDLFKGAA